jgi:teichuronic acid biosynthesis glycosyltransferase TuaG
LVSGIEENPLSQDLISIIMPAYRSAKYIGDSIRSVQSQTYPHWELLITNDCSPDNLEEVVLGFTQVDSRIKYFCLPSNSGPAAARNNSISHSKGRFIAFLDSDDCWTRSKLEKQLSFMNTNHFPFTFTHYQRIDTNGNLYNFINTCPSTVTYQTILKDTCITTSTVMLDKQHIPEVRLVKGWGYDDYVLWLNILKQGIDAHCLKENLVYYRVMEQSVSSNKLRAAKWVWNIYREHEKLGLLPSFIYLFCYAKNAFLKRIRLIKPIEKKD